MSPGFQLLLSVGSLALTIPECSADGSELVLSPEFFIRARGLHWQCGGTQRPDLFCWVRRTTPTACLQPKGPGVLVPQPHTRSGGDIISLAVALAFFLFMARPFQGYPLPSNDTTARIASSHTANKRKKTESFHCDGLCLAPASWQLTAASRAQCPRPLTGLQTLSK